MPMVKIRKNMCKTGSLDLHIEGQCFDFRALFDAVVVQQAA